MTADTTKDQNLNSEREPWWLLVDPFFVFTTAGIGVIGVLLVYSATRGSGVDIVDPDRTYLDRQVLFLVVGASLGVLASFIEPDWIRKLAPAAYGMMIASMCAVLVIGVEIHGARSWFSVGNFQLQPSELGKVVVIVVLALAFSARSGGVGPRRLGLGLLLAAVPALLVTLQPDPGTVLVYLAILVTVVVVSGVEVRWLALLALMAVAGAIWVFGSDVLAGYQQARLTVFLFDPDRVGAEVAEYAYNAEQAQIAIGNGGLRGQGLFQGTQTRSNLVPAQQTDFIFTVAGEELGLRGAGLLLGLYGLLTYRIWRTARNASSVFGRLLCTGVLAMILFQLFQSVGMTMGMMPVTGIPMPLVSYGGSSMLTSMIALGLVAGVHRRRYAVDEMRR